jgi:hypothetical protein
MATVDRRRGTTGRHAYFLRVLLARTAQPWHATMNCDAR